jgi:hypothetical protein
MYDDITLCDLREMREMIHEIPVGALSPHLS